MSTTTEQTQIKHWVSGILIYEGPGTLKEVLEAAVSTGANLTGAYLRGADLTGADLTGADLTDADLRDAYLTDANLTGADLTGANLTGADLTGAYLTDADLRGANLTDANLTPIRDDLHAVLRAAPAEAPGLLAALKAGRIDGSVYEGECACLVGTIAKLRHCDYTCVPGLTPDGSRPAERWFLAIQPGDTPETNVVAAITAEWVEAWIAEHPVEAPHA